METHPCGLPQVAVWRGPPPIVRHILLHGAHGDLADLGFVGWHTPHSLRIFHLFESYFCLLSPPPSLCITSSLSGSRNSGASRTVFQEDWNHQVGIIFLLKNVSLRGRNCYQPITLLASSCSSIPVYISVKRGGKLFLYNWTFGENFNKISDHVTSRLMVLTEACFPITPVLLFWQRTKTSIILPVYLICEYGESLVWVKMSPELSFSPYPAPEATILRSEGFTVGRRKFGEKKAVK